MRGVQIISGVAAAIAAAPFVYFKVLFGEAYQYKGYEFFIQIAAFGVVLGVPALLTFLVATWRLRREKQAGTLG
jgi:hypothetical protein